MEFFLVTMRHPDGDGWNRELAPHIRYLRDLVGQGVLQASGPLKDSPKRAGFLIFRAEDEATVRRWIGEDPFATAGLIEELTVAEWDPLFGQFAAESSGLLAGRPASDFV